MKKIKFLYKILLALIIFSACTDEVRDLTFLTTLEAPSNVAATYDITQDNTGLVTITPTADGAESVYVFFGDGTDEYEALNNGESIQRVYTEGIFDLILVAYNANGDPTEVTQQLIVSFQAPQNMVASVENDIAVSKQVNITATADFATMFDFYSGEVGVTQPAMTGNIGETISYIYATAGTYAVKVVAKGAAIETLEYAVDFEVTEILAPTKTAPTPPNRNDGDYISIFSDAYTDVTLNEIPTTWSETNFEVTTIGTDNVWKLSNLDFLGMVTNYDTGIDVSLMEKLHIDYWVPSGTTSELLVKIVNTLDGGEDIESLGTTVAGSWQSIDLDMTGFDGGNLANKEKITQILIDADVNAGIVYIDNFYFYKASSASTFNDGLLTNGDFENGSDSWLIGTDDASSVSLGTNGGNSYYSVNVTSAGNPYDVNMSQKLEIIEGNTYTLTFDAWSDVNRPIVAGIGLSAAPWSNSTETVDITPTRTTYSVTLSATNYGALDARVLFDLGAAVGAVYLDNISLFIGKGNTVINGDFENGSNSWLIGTDDTSSAPVVTDGGNTYYSVDVAAAGNPYDVNVSQKLEIIEGNTYTLRFDAWSDVNRPIVAGIGLSAAPWSNTTETVDITATRSSYSVTLVATGFGAVDARVLFDLGAAVGAVNIDDVSLSSN